MSHVPETAGERSVQEPQYQKAEPQGAVTAASTASVPPEVRTVVTTVTDGTIALRYTPRDPSRLTGRTSP